MGLLGELYGFGDSLKRRLRDAARNPVGMLSQLQDQIIEDLKAYGQKNKAAIENPSKENVKAMVDSNMQVVGMAPLGMIAYHGSPHKFSKFDMSKIGTGEGAQAYGHGLYMAEVPEVAKNYVGGKAGFVSEPLIGGKTIDQLPKSIALELDRISNGTLSGVLDNLRKSSNPNDVLDFYIKSNGRASAVAKKLKEIGVKAQDTTNIYKVDIPDEAVARFLDWDKKLSEQAPEVQAALAQMHGVSPDVFSQMQKLNPDKFDMTAGEFVGRKSREGFAPYLSDDLQKQGIPGIRYLDGGSRSAGQGTSNYVLFDDQLPRILEINGQPTGNKPWNRGEWKFEDPFKEQFAGDFPD